MINVKELRIGNYIYEYDIDGETLKSIEVDGYMIEKMWLNKSNEYEPILLTPEILEKCGFEEYTSDLYSGVFLKTANMNMFKWCNIALAWCQYNPNYEEGWVVAKYFKYLHELQNFHFIMSNEELQINATYVNRIN